MADSISVDIDEAKLQRFLASVSRRLPEGEAKMVTELAAKATPILRASAPKKSGKLARSIRPYRDRDGSIVVGSRKPQARILDEGGVIVPRGATLAIPVTGQSRRRARAVAGLEVVRRQGGNNMLGRTTAKGGFEARFTLVNQVTIRATRYIQSAERDVRGEAPRTALDVVRRVILGGPGEA